MANLESSLTDDDFSVILDALDEWKSSGPNKSRPARREKAVLVMAKLLLLKRSIRLETLDIEAKPTRDDRKLQLAEQFIHDCGIWKHFGVFLEGQPAES